MPRPHVHRSVGDRLPRRRLLLVVVVAIACTVASATWIGAIGATGRLRLDEYAGCDPSTIDVRIEPPGIASATEVSAIEGVPVVSVAGISEGSGTIVVSLPDGGMAVELRVLPGCVVVMDRVDFGGWEAIGWSLAMFFSASAIVHASEFAWLWRRARYGYGMVLFLGASAFCFLQAIEFLQVMLSGKAHGFSDLALMILTISERFMLLILPFVVAASLLVAASNIVLMRHEGRSPANMLGVALCLSLVAFCVAWRVLSALSMVPDIDPVVGIGVGSILSTFGAFTMTMLLATSACAWLAAIHRPMFPRDYVIVLGSGLSSDGTPTPLLAGRIDAAIDFAGEQAAAGMRRPHLVMSGGQGDDEPTSEAAAMRDYAVGRGFPAESILLEDSSTSTQENMSLSREVLEKDMAEHGRGDDTASVAFATTNYHVLRGYVHAWAAGLDAEGISSPTKWYFWPNAFLREFAGLVAARPLAIPVTLASIVAVYGTAEYIVLLG